MQEFISKFVIFTFQFDELKNEYIPEINLSMIIDHETNNSIYIPFEYFTDIGGPSTFMLNLKRYLDGKGYHYQTQYKKNDDIFFPIQFDLKLLSDVKASGGRVIQRLDGVYYPSKHGEKYISLNDQLKTIYIEYADHVVFQSDYSRKQCFAMLGIKTETDFTIITNGVHRDLFFPGESKKLSSPIQLVVQQAILEISICLNRS